MRGWGHTSTGHPGHDGSGSCSEQQQQHGSCLGGAAGVAGCLQLMGCSSSGQAPGRDASSSAISKFPGPNTRQRKGSSICALPNTRRCKPRWQLPLCSTFSLFFSRCREPSLVSDAECVFAVYVQGDWSYYFGAGKGMEEQSFVLIANLNKLIF